MKRIVVVLIFVFCLCISVLAGCGKSVNRQTADGRRDEKKTEAFDDDPAPTPKPTSTPKPTNTSTPTPSPKPLINVEDALCESISVNDRIEFYRIPKVYISDVDTTQTNAKIYNDIINTYSYKKSDFDNSIEYYGTLVDYEYYISEKTISILIKVEQLECDYGNAQVYNILIEDGSLLSDDEFLNIIGLDSEELLSYVKESYNEAWIRDRTQYGNLDEGIYERNIKKFSMDTVKPYLREDNRICFIGYVEDSVGNGSFWRIFETNQICSVT